MKKTPKRLSKLHLPGLSLSKILLVILLLVGGGLVYLVYMANSDIALKNRQLAEVDIKSQQLKGQIDDLNQKIITLESEDQRKKNKDLEDEIKNIKTTYQNAVKVYESLIDLKQSNNSNAKLEQLFASALSILGQGNYASASAQLAQLTKDIDSQKQKTATSSSGGGGAPAPVSNSPPGSGYSRQQVQTDAGNFTVTIVSADLASTKVIVDTASDSDCANNCPALPLGTYVSRNSAFAGVNGSYFCPATYPSCAGKTNSFDLLLMNKNKTYFNSSNNVYSNNPAVIFGGSYIRFVSAASQWGRDTGIDSMISNYPLLLEGGNIKVTSTDDPKMSGKGNRSFVANKGNTVYIGVAFNVTVSESAKVMKTLGMENALNLDSGGSTALWSGGYKVGPGRDIPNAILFVRK